MASEPEGEPVDLPTATGIERAVGGPWADVTAVVREWRPGRRASSCAQRRSTGVRVGGARTGGTCDAAGGGSRGVHSPEAGCGPSTPDHDGPARTTP